MREQLQDSIIRNYDSKGRPIADLQSIPRDTTVHPLRDPDDDPRTLEHWEAMVERPELSYVRRYGRSESVGKAKQMKFVAGPVGGLGGMERIRPVRFRVYGLTRGEVEFYRARPGIAYEVLAEYVERADEQGVGPEKKRTRSKRRLLDFEVYGLSERQAAVLKAAPGAARGALAEFARKHDGDRIQLRDESFVRRKSAADVGGPPLVAPT